MAKVVKTEPLTVRNRNARFLCGRTEMVGDKDGGGDGNTAPVLVERFKSEREAEEQIP
jgi:hypothetical protein